MNVNRLLQCRFLYILKISKGSIVDDFNFCRNPLGFVGIGIAPLSNLIH